mgnify:CR=1 FL=1
MDRDGVINKDLFNYVTKPEQFEFLKGSLEAIVNLYKNDFRIIIATNQACIGSGKATFDQVNEVNNFMLKEIKSAGGNVEKIMVCPHNKMQGCGCRKPEIGLLLKAEEELGETLEGIYFIGDKESDVRAALNHGSIPILVRTGYGLETLKSNSLPKDLKCFDNLLSATNYIVSK